MQPNVAVEIPAANEVGGSDFEPPRDDLLQCLAYIAKFYGDERTLASWRQGLPAGQVGASAHVVLDAADEAGFHSTLVRRGLKDVPAYLFPVIVLLKDERACVWRSRDGGTVEVVMAEGSETMLPLQMPFDELNAQASGYCMFIKPPVRRDERAGIHLQRIPRAGSGARCGVIAVITTTWCWRRFW